MDKAALLASRGLGTEKVDVPGFGEVEVRGLTRAEALSVQQVGEIDIAEMERRLLSLALVEPKLTEDEVGQWQQVATAGELQPVAATVERLSGLAVKAVKAEMQRFR